MTKFQGGIISSTQNVAIGNQYTGRANGIWALPHQMQSKQAALWAQSKAPPSAPTITNVTAANTIATVEFSPPASLNGEIVTGYTVTSSGGQSVTGASSPIIVTGLTNGTSYTFTVVANSTSGPSVASNTSSSVVPAEFLVPGVPTIGTALVQYNIANIPFTAPASDGGKPITSYTATSSPGGITGTLNQSGSGTIVVSGLTAGVSYTFTVTATNMIGNSSPSAASNSVSASNSPLGLWGWGNNLKGALGITGSYATLPTQIGSLTNWSNISCGYFHSVATTTSGTLFSWGTQDYYGQLGIGNLTAYSSPKQVGALTNWSRTASGNHFSIAIKTDGTLWGWGANGYGNIGQSNTSTGISSPIQIGTMTNWNKIACGGNHVLSIKTDGTLWAWGSNNFGQLGIGSTAYRSSPVQVGALTNWLNITASIYTSVATKTDGTIWVWGSNREGVLGLGDAAHRSSPVQVGALTNWSKVALGYSHTLAIKTDGTLWSWGNNGDGQLGLGNTTYYSSPKQVGSSTNWSIITSETNGNYSIAMKTDGTVWGWGSGNYGQNGTENRTNKSSPTQIGALTSWNSISGGYSHALATQSAISLPGAPTGISATRIPNATSATVSFTAPANNGGLTISKYTATSSPSGFTGVLNQAGSGTITVTGLDANTAYTFTVTATNFMGTGSASSAVATVTPATLLAWGRNQTGQLGLGTSGNYISTPIQVGTLTNWSVVSCAGTDSNSLAIKTDGTLWAWGNNPSGELGLSDVVNRSSPTQVGTLTTWKTIAGGNSFNLAVKTDGTLWATGDNGNGQLGLGDQVTRSNFTQVGLLTNWSKITTFSGCALAVKTDGTLWSWGNNIYGQLGLGNTTYYSSPKQVGALTNWSNIANGWRQSVAIKTDGTLWTWGYNGQGQLGTGDTTNRSSPVQIGTLTNWSKVAGAFYHTVAIKTDGTLWAFGSNYYGMLGRGNTTDSYSPIQIGSLTNWLNISAAQYYNIAIKTDGTLWTWGGNDYYQQGLGDITNRSSPTQIGSATSWSNVSTGVYNVLATRTVSPPDAPTITSATRSTGSTTATINFTAPTYNGGYAITSYTATSSPGGITGSVSQAGSGSITVTGLNAGTIYTFTVTATNSLGTGPASAVAATVAPARLFVWGDDSLGQLGLGNTTNYSSPKQVGALTNWLYLKIGKWHSTAGKLDGTLWAWGYNSSGQLGLGDITNRSSPVQVGALTNWLSTAAGDEHTIAIKTDGTLWSCGRNHYGQLGLSDTTNRSNLIQVGALTNWNKISACHFMSMATKTDGTLWMWGYNAWGQLGLENTTYYSSPKQVGALTNWSKIACGKGVAAIKTDGTLWTWGNNDYFQLGLGVGKNGSKNSPNQVGTLTNWSDVYSNYSHMIAIKTDGTLWAWGNNDAGQSGLGDSGYYAWRNSPVQVGALTSWSSASAGEFHTMATKTDGTLWTWGYNGLGPLGLGNTTNYSSPKQVGNLTNWKLVSAGGQQSLALQNA